MDLHEVVLLIIILTLTILASNYFLINEAFDGDNDGEPVPILNLVLYSRDHGGPYDEMKKITEKYYTRFSFLTTYYYCFRPEQKEEFALEGNMLYIKGEESYIPGILDKTLRSFEYFKNKLPSYAYIVRSNVSTIIRFDLLEKDLRHNAVQYGCALCFGKEFSSGTSMIFSPEIILNLINNKDKIDKNVIDDLSIGHYITKEMPEVELQPVLKNEPEHGFHYIPNLGADQTKIRALLNNNKIIFFRNHNGDRELDAKQMKIIVDVLDEKDALNP
jgi:hypothetical protein